jgi:hypothetical protein
VQESRRDEVQPKTPRRCRRHSPRTERQRRLKRRSLRPHRASPRGRFESSRPS